MGTREGQELADCFQTVLLVGDSKTDAHDEK